MRDHYDIIIVGGGLSGACAAISAARLGKSVMLIEAFNCLGGAAVTDLVIPFMPNNTQDPVTKERIELSAGLYLEILNGLHALDASLAPWRECFNEESLKLLLNRMTLQAGVELLLNSTLTSVKVSDEYIKSVTVSGVSGSMELYADYFIDATGDGNLAFMSGCDFVLGRESDGRCQPMTLCFRLGSVNMENYRKIKDQINPLWARLRSEGKITNPRENLLIFNTVSENILHFNSTRIVGLDPTDVAELTKAEIMAREQVFEIVAFLRDNFPSAFKDAVILSTGMRIGVRESRKIVCKYTLTKEDIIGCCRFDDSIALCNYDIDIHSPDGTGTSHYYFKDGEYYSIPYRSLLPKGISNLIITGRCIGATHEAQASLRIMPVCCTLGQAAGAAAALSSDSGTAVGDINTSTLRDILLSQGANI